MQLFNYIELNSKINAQLFPSGNANLVSSNCDVDTLNTSAGAITHVWMRTLISLGWWRVCADPAVILWLWPCATPCAEAAVRKKVSPTAAWTAACLPCAQITATITSMRERPVRVLCKQRTATPLCLETLRIQRCDIYISKSDRTNTTDNLTFLQNGFHLIYNIAHSCCKDVHFSIL